MVEFEGPVKVLLICPTSLLFMPYAISYVDALKLRGVDFDLLIWDRFNLHEELSGLIYRDGKTGHPRGGVDYLKFSRYASGIIDSGKYKKIIIFGIQLSFFLAEKLVTKFENNFILDIRDRHFLVGFMRMKRLVDSSRYTVISSEGYRTWLPVNDNKVLIDHNISDEKVNRGFLECSIDRTSGPVTISCIGALRDYKANTDLVRFFGNIDDFKIVFNGDGVINNKLESFVDKFKFRNVYMRGRYSQNDEAGLYRECDVVNVVRYPDSMNNRTALPNRIYNAAFYGKPVVCFGGTYLSYLVNEYHLGVVLDLSVDRPDKIICYLDEFSMDNFNNGRSEFFSKVRSDKQLFNDALDNFVDL